MLKYLSSVATALAVVVFSIGTIGLHSVKSQERSVAPAHHFRVIRDKSITFVVPPFATAVMGNLDIADVLPESDRLIYVQGKKIGTTNITLYDQNKKLVEVIDLDVTLDLEEIRNNSFWHGKPRHPRIRQQKPNRIERRSEECGRRGPRRRHRQVISDNGRREGSGPRQSG